MFSVLQNRCCTQFQRMSISNTPDAPVIRVVLDNLNIHRMASLYETFAAAEARRIVKRLEFHHTPKHASWLNMAGIEFSVLTRDCSGDATATRRHWSEPSAPMKPGAPPTGPGGRRAYHRPRRGSRPG